jgi:hypothetical protein
MRLKPDGDPYSYISDMRTIASSFSNLEIGVEAIQQYFFWNGLNEKFQNLLVLITNTNKPSLDQINAHIFEATERYVQQLQKKPEPRPKCKEGRADFQVRTEPHLEPVYSHNFAVNVDREKQVKFVPCNLCTVDGRKNVTHKIRDCTIYDTALKKTNKLIEIGGCTKCSFKNHVASVCRFKFISKCRVCNGGHMSYLCAKTGPSGTNSRASTSKPGTSYSTLAWIQALHNHSADDSILLPTLTCKVGTGKQAKVVRALKDGGCQRNFVTTSLAESHGWQIIKGNLQLVVHGFNSSRSIETCIVKVPLTIDNQLFEIDAVCIPEIRINLEISRLKDVVESFLQKGYLLADKFLHNCQSGMIGNVDLILGTDSDHVLDMTYKKFGDCSIKSCYIETPIGVILTGNVSRMLDNVAGLPLLDDFKLPDTIKQKQAPVGALAPNETDYPYFSGRVSCLNVLVGLDEVLNAVSGDDHLQGVSCGGTASGIAVSVLNDQEEVIESLVEKATDDALREQTKQLMKYDSGLVESIQSETNVKLVN